MSGAGSEDPATIWYDPPPDRHAEAEDPASIRQNPAPVVAEWLEYRANPPAAADRPLQKLPPCPAAGAAESAIGD
jgi:hypothetical protein